MSRYSQTSLDRLHTCEEPLIRLFELVVVTFDCTILEGVRTVEQQQKNIAKGVSKTMKSKHIPLVLGGKSKAVDAAPYPLQWPQKMKGNSPGETTRWMKEYGQFYLFGGYVLGIAESMNIKIRWGGDWDGDFQINDQ